MHCSSCSSQLDIAGLGALGATSVIGNLLARSALGPVKHYRGGQRRSIINGVPGVPA
jgi:hypothetical protein